MSMLNKGRRAFVKGLGTLPLAAAAVAGAETALRIGSAAAQDHPGVVPAEPSPSSAPSISRAPTEVPPPIGGRGPQRVRIDLETIEVRGRLADGTSYQYWTFNGKVPGPLFRVRVGDTVEVHLRNNAESMMNHNVDFHAVSGPHGGGMATDCAPGEEKGFSFKALKPGLYVYHCATPSVAMHISNGMYGMILVEPEGGLAKVDREFYIMQGEIYTEEPFGTKGEANLSVDKLLAEMPEYFVFNGAVGALLQEQPLKARVGETVRLFFGVGGPNKASSFHVIGQIFGKLYDQGSLSSKPLEDVQTTTVPPGGAVVTEMRMEVPGTFVLVDHALSRAERGLKGALVVEGPDNPEIFDTRPSSVAGL